MEEETLKRRIKFLRIEGPKGRLDQSAVAAAVGLSTNQYQRYEYGTSQKRKIIDRLADFYGCNKGWLLTGQGDPFPGAGETPSSGSGPEASEFTTIPPQPDFPSEDFVFIRRVNGRISAGEGLVPDDTADVQCAFRRDWIRRKGGAPSRMSLISVSGDSMEPTLLAGDLVLVDHSRTTVAPQGGIYAISLDQGIMIKRLQIIFPQNRIRILSDNAHYAPIDVDPEQFKINGKVIWFGRDIDR